MLAIFFQRKRALILEGAWHKRRFESFCPRQALNISEKLQDRNSAASPPGANNDTEGQGSPAGEITAKKQ